MSESAAFPKAAPLAATQTPPKPVPAVTDGEGAERDLDAAREIAEARRAVTLEIGKRIIGQDIVIEHLLVALFARGHCLFVGVPGLAKTLLIQTLSDALALSFGRIQLDRKSTRLN